MSRRTSRRAAATALVATAALVASGLTASAVPAAADTAAQPLPFAQDWSDTGLITTNDDWSGVPGLVGHLGDDPTTTAAPVDPRLSTSASSTVDVIANQTSPSTSSAGGVAEFELADPTVALQGSGTADAPHLVATVRTTGATGTTVSYRLRDLDGSADDAVQAVALQYRVGTTGAYTDVPAGYVADATTGGTATQVTRVSAVLPAAADDQPVVQVRVITGNAAGSDEWVGVDDLRIAAAGTSTGPAAPVASCPAEVSTRQGTATSADLSATDADSGIAAAEITSAAVAGTSLTGFTASSAGQPGRVTLAVSDAVAAGSHPVDVRFTTDGASPQTTTCTVRVVVVPLVLVSAVQGSGATSPLVGQRVSVEGVVTGLKTSGDAVSAFFVQEQDTDVDADPATSEGVLVLCGTACLPGLAAGDVVTVTGLVEEANGSTRLSATAPGSTTRSATGAVRPTAAVVTLPASGSTEAQATFERFEGMLTTIPTTLTVTEFFELARFGQLELSSGGRPYQYTHVDATPTVAENAAHLAALAARRIVLDDGSDDQNDAVTGATDEPYPYPTGGLSVRNRLRGGDTVAGLTGVMDYGFGAWRIQPVPSEEYRFEPGNPRTAAPDAVGGDLRFASFNVLNYFATLDTTTSSSSGPCAPSGTQDCRGADSAAELERQRAKIVAALEGIDADVLGLIEIQNDDGAATVQLLDALNAATAPGTYDHVRTGAIGTDAIKLAMLYKPAKVTPVGAFRVLDSSVDPRFVDTRSRPALVQTFRENATGARVTLALNHLKSKGSGCGAGDDATDGSGNCDGTRTRAAEALRDFLATDPTGSGDSDVLVMGDLNSYRNERPITTFEAAGYTDLVERFQGDTAYGYLFDGQLGYLDHALASRTLAGQVTGATEWHINADEPIELDYNDTVRDAGEAAFERRSAARDLYDAGPYRSSDHDAVVVGLDLTVPSSAPAPLPASPSPSASPSASASPATSAGPSAAATPATSASPSTTATAGPTAPPPTSASPAPSAPAACPAVAPLVQLGARRTTATGSTSLTVRGPAGALVDVLAYTRPATAYRVVRTGTVGADGRLVLPDLRPSGNTRLYAEVRGCPADAVSQSVVLDVSTRLTITALRTGPRRYVFAGDSLPARRGGLIVSLYRVTADGREVLTAQTRASATTGEWRLERRFLGSGRFGFVVRTGQDLQNAPGASAVRPTLVF